MAIDPALPTSWRGYQQIHMLPGGFRLSRRFAGGDELNLAGWTEVNIRAQAWAPSCIYLPDAPVGQRAADAAARAVLKEARFRLVSGTRLDIAEEQTPDSRWNSLDVNAPGYVLAVPGWAARTGWWWRTSGAVTAEVELYFDIPTAPAGA